MDKVKQQVQESQHQFNQKTLINQQHSNQKGMTLVEVLVVVALSSLFFVATCPLVVTLLRGTIIMREEIALQQEQDIAIAFIQDHIKKAKAVQIWGCIDRQCMTLNKELFHQRTSLVEGQLFYVRGILLDAGPSDTLEKVYDTDGVIWVKQSALLERTGTITYAKHVMLNDTLRDLTFTRQGDKLVGKMTSVLSNEGVIEREFLIEQDNKLVVLEE